MVRLASAHNLHRGVDLANAVPHNDPQALNAIPATAAAMSTSRRPGQGLADLVTDLFPLQPGQPSVGIFR